MELAVKTGRLYTPLLVSLNVDKQPEAASHLSHPVSFTPHLSTMRIHFPLNGSQRLTQPYTIRNLAAA